MKKIMMVILSMLLLFSLAGCGNEPDSTGSVPTSDENASGDNSVPTSTGDAGVAFEAPQEYAVKLLISVNPKFTAYLDSDGAVLAVEFMNEDAEVLRSRVKSEGGTVAELVGDIITAANEKGFFGEEPRFNIDLIESKCSTLETDGVLGAAHTSAMNCGKEIGLTVVTLRNGSIFEVNGEQVSAVPSESSSQPAPNTSSSRPIASSASVHTHSFSKASCTTPQTCSCGATGKPALGHAWQSADCQAPKTCKTCGVTEGTALGHAWKSADCQTPKTCKTCGATEGTVLGHAWQSASCQAPKTCKTCGATEGSKGDHSYTNGTCSVCGDSQYINPKTNLKYGAEYLGNFAPKNEPGGRMLYGWGLYTSSEPDGNILYTRCYSSTDDGGRKITFQGEAFYSAGGGPNVMSKITITDTEIIAGTGFSDDTPYVKFSMLKNGRLVVTYSKDVNYPVGMQLSADENEFLTVE